MLPRCGADPFYGKLDELIKTESLTMTDALPNPYRSNPDNDEIAISELLLKLWAKRGLIFFLPLIFAGITIVSLLIGKTSQQNEVSYYIELNGITLNNSASSSERNTEEEARRNANGTKVTSGGSRSIGSSNIVAQYPNGTVFLPQDLTNPSVIALLSRESGLSAQDLAMHIDVQFGTPISNGVLEEYKVALSANSDASVQDLAALNEHYELKLNATAKRGLKIVVDYVALDISLDEGVNLATLLPKQWNRVYTTQFRTQMTPDIASLRWTDRDFDISSAIGLQEADVQLRNLKRGAELIAADDRLRGLQNANGALAADLAGYIDDFRAIFFDPLFLGAFSKDDTLTRVYTRDLRFAIDELDRQIEELNNRLADISGFQGQGGSMGTTSSSGRDTTQLDGDALSAVVNLAEQAALSSYLQNSLDQRYELIKRRAASATRLERINSDAAGEQIGNEFMTLANTRYLDITSSYKDILGKAQTILAAQTPSFYSVITQPDTEGSLIAKRDLLFLALAMASGVMLAIIVALVWPKPESVS